MHGLLRTTALLCGLLSSTCSRSSSGMSPDAAPTEKAQLAAGTAPDGSADASPVEAEPPQAPPRHAVTLPAPKVPTWKLRLTAGELPSPAHPAGTVFVIGAMGPDTVPLTVSEWDLDSGRELQQAKLPINGGYPPEAAFDGDHVIVVGFASTGGPFLYRLSRSLKVLSAKPAPDMGWQPNAVASNGQLTIVVAPGRVMDRSKEAAPCIAATYDGAGKLIAQRTLQPFGVPSSADFTANAALAGGSAYVLLGGTEGIRLHRLAPNLDELGSVLVDPAMDGAPFEGWIASLRAEGDHLRADVYSYSSEAMRSYDVTLDLSSIKPAPPSPPLAESPCNKDAVSVGSVRARLCLVS